MLIADVPPCSSARTLASKIPIKLVHSIAAGVFALLGVTTVLVLVPSWGWRIARLGEA